MSEHEEEHIDYRNRINCLRCRQCKLLPETDMSDRRTLIHCGHLSDKREINLNGCSAADPRTRWIGSHPNAVLVNGDKSRALTSAAKAFLEANYNDAISMEVMEKVTGYSAPVIRRAARNMNLKRSEASLYKSRCCTRAQVMKKFRKDGKRYFNEAQREYILDCYNSDNWPDKVTNNTAKRLANDRRKARIVEEVARLGYAFQWISIRRYACINQPSSRRDAARKAREKLNN